MLLSELLEDTRRYLERSCAEISQGILVLRYLREKFGLLVKVYRPNYFLSTTRFELLLEFREVLHVDDPCSACKNMTVTSFRDIIGLDGG